MLRQSAGLFFEIGGGNVQFQKMGDTGRSVECHPIDEFVVIPKRFVIPNTLKVTTKHILRIGVLRYAYRLAEVTGTTNVRCAQRSQQEIERLLLRKMRRN